MNKILIHVPSFEKCLLPIKQIIHTTTQAVSFPFLPIYNMSKYLHE